MLTTAALALFVCLPLSILAVAVLSRTRAGSFFGLPAWVRGQGLFSWLRLAAGAHKASRQDWEHFSALLQGQPVPAAARLDYRPAPALQPTHLPPPATPFLGMRLGMVLAALGVALLVLSSLSRLFLAPTSSALAYAAVLTAPVQAAISSDEGFDIARATFPLEKVPQVMTRAADMGFAPLCSDQLIASSSLPAPSYAGVDWLTCTGSFSGYEFTLQPLSNDQVVLVLAPSPS